MNVPRSDVDPRRTTRERALPYKSQPESILVMFGNSFSHNTYFNDVTSSRSLVEVIQMLFATGNGIPLIVRTLYHQNGDAHKWWQRGQLPKKLSPANVPAGLPLKKTNTNGVRGMRSTVTVGIGVPIRQLKGTKAVLCISCSDVKCLGGGNYVLKYNENHCAPAREPTRSGDCTSSPSRTQSVPVPTLHSGVY